MIRIQLVRTRDGYLVGRTLSDKWNLMQLGFAKLADTRNQAEVKRLRRAIATSGGGFVASVVNASVAEVPTVAEYEAFGGDVPAYLSRAA